jgi:Rieske Fe-S protein
MKRRSFIKRSCLVCAGLAAGTSVLTLLEGCATAKIQKVSVVNKVISIDAALCNELQKVLVLRTDDLEYDVLLYYVSNANYSAVLLKCTHYDNPVFVNNKEVFCPSHGSKFDYTGKVLTEPATQSLKSFKVKLDNQTIKINIS